MKNLVDYGLCVVDGVPKATGQVAQVAQRVAYLQETLYGKTWHVKVVPNPHNAAYSNVPLPIHMDLWYRTAVRLGRIAMRYKFVATPTSYYESPPGLQMLHFIATECRGGANSFGTRFVTLEKCGR